MRFLIHLYFFLLPLDYCALMHKQTQMYFVEALKFYCLSLEISNFCSHTKKKFRFHLNVSRRCSFQQRRAIASSQSRIISVRRLKEKTATENKQISEKSMLTMEFKFIYYIHKPNPLGLCLHQLANWSCSCNNYCRSNYSLAGCNFE